MSLVFLTSDERWLEECEISNALTWFLGCRAVPRFLCGIDSMV